MKKSLLLTFSFIVLVTTLKAQQTFAITSSGFQFLPATLTITAGDTVQFNQSASHPAREVSLTTWNNNQSTSNGGFDNLHSGAKIKLSTPGTYYYVCSNHFASGMKGQIVVQSGASVEENSANVSLNAYPSPVISNLNISLNLTISEELSVEIYNVIGEQVYFKNETVYPSGNTLLNIDFSEFAQGAYFIKVIGKEEQYSMKVMK